MEADQLIAEIAKTTGLRLDKADPVLAAAVINEVLLDRALVKLDRQVRIQADRVTVASTQAVLDAKKEAELLNHPLIPVTQIARRIGWPVRPLWRKPP